jgi:hypothetical protein
MNTIIFVLQLFFSAMVPCFVLGYMCASILELNRREREQDRRLKVLSDQISQKSGRA